MTHPRPWPRLSETLMPAHELHVCQNCMIAESHTVERWREHDDNDRPTSTIVLLCTACSAAIIEPHPRLYAKLDKWEPAPGSMMKLCAGCKRRDGTRCTHPDLKANGGTGLPIKFPQPIHAHVNRGRGRSGFMNIWQGPPSECAGRVILELVEE